MDPTSEQELKQLLEEGRITEEEYKELLEALRQKETAQKPAEVPPKPNAPKPRTGYGRAALILMIIGILLPIVAIMIALVFHFIDVKLAAFLFMPFFLIGLLCGLLAFIFGIIGWKSKAGKVAAIGVPCLGVLFVIGWILFVFLFYVRCETVVVEEFEHQTVSLPYQATPSNTRKDVLEQGDLTFDKTVSYDGNGSLKIQTSNLRETAVRLLKADSLDTPNHVATYSAKLKSEHPNVTAYLEMWCEVEGKGKYFFRGNQCSMESTTDWAEAVIHIDFEDADSIKNVQLNLVIKGAGAVWVDDIKLGSRELEALDLRSINNL